MTSPLYPRQITNSRKPAAPKDFMMCQRIGLWPIGIIGFGILSATSRMRVPNPPHNKIVFNGCPAIQRREVGIEIAWMQVEIENTLRQSDAPCLGSGGF